MDGDRAVRPAPVSLASVEADVWTREHLRARGFSDSSITRWARAGELRRLSRGLYAGPSGEAGVAAIARALAPRVALSHLTAARAWGLPVPETTSETVVVRHGGHHRAIPAGITARQTRAWSVETREGLLLTPPARTVADVARTHDIATALPVADAALRSGLVERCELATEIASRPSAAGSRRAARVVALADGRAESPLESLLRLALVLGGLPPDDLQHEVRESGRFVARVDLWYDGLVVEADGFEFHRERDDYRRDRRKGQAFARLGLLALRFSWEDVAARPEAVVASVRAALAMRMVGPHARLARVG